MPMKKEKEAWNARAERDVYGAIVTSQDTWNPEDYYRTGREDFEKYVLPVVDGMDTKAMVCLDFGAGTGRITRSMATIFGRVIGVDISEVLLEQARKDNPGIEFYSTDGEDLKHIESGSIDFVFSYATLQHFTSQTSVGRLMRELHRVMKQGAIAHFDVRMRPAGATGKMIWWRACDRFAMGLMLWHRYIPVPFFRKYDSLHGVSFSEEQIKKIVGLSGLQIKDMAASSSRTRWITAIRNDLL